MRIALQQQQKGLQQAQDQIHLASSRIARWGLNTESASDQLRVDGVERPRSPLTPAWRPQSTLLDSSIDLGEEALRLKTSEWAFRANIAATRSVLDLERKAAELLDDSKNKN